MPAGSVSPARACAYAVVRRVFEQGAYADRALHAEARSLAGRDRALAMALAYGTVQRRATLDHVAAALHERPPERLDAAGAGRAAAGPDAAAAAWTASPTTPPSTRAWSWPSATAAAAAGLVNAVLRRAAREGREVLRGARATARRPMPPSCTRCRSGWQSCGGRELGPDRPGRCWRRQPARRVGAARQHAGRLRRRVGRRPRRRLARGAGDRRRGWCSTTPFDAHGSALWTRGRVMPQSRASMHVARTLAPAAGERVLDLCAAPGAKTTHLAALTGDAAGLVAVERHSGRAARAAGAPAGGCTCGSHRRDRRRGRAATRRRL